MCTTCGCGNTDEVQYSALPANSRLITLFAPHHSHDHPHGPDHDHDHDHNHDHDHHHDHAVVGPGTVIALEKEILAKNQLLADRNRSWFTDRGILALNLMSSQARARRRCWSARLQI